MKEKEKSKLGQVLGSLDIYAAVVVLIALILLTFVGVLRRYIFRSPIAWMEEMQMIMFLWVVFLAAGAAFRSGSHIAIEILVDSLPKKIGKFIERLDVVFQLIIVGYLTFQSCVYYMQFVETGKTTIFLHLPYTVAYIVLPVGCFLMLVSIVYAAVKDFKESKRGGEA